MHKLWNLKCYSFVSTVVWLDDWNERWNWEVMLTRPKSSIFCKNEAFSELVIDGSYKSASVNIFMSTDYKSLRLYHRYGVDFVRPRQLKNVQAWVSLWAVRFQRKWTPLLRRSINKNRQKAHPLFRLPCWAIVHVPPAPYSNWATAWETSKGWKLKSINIIGIELEARYDADYLCRRLGWH